MKKHICTALMLGSLLLQAGVATAAPSALELLNALEKKPKAQTAGVRGAGGDEKLFGGEQTKMGGIKEDDSSEGSGPGMLLLVYGLGFALIVYGAASWIKKKKVDALLEEESGLRVLDSTWIGKGQRLVLVGVGDQRILIGASSGGLRQLAVMPPPGAAAQEEGVTPRSSRAKKKVIQHLGSNRPGGRMLVEDLMNKEDPTHPGLSAREAPTGRPSHAKIEDADADFERMIEEELRRTSPPARQPTQAAWGSASEHKVRAVIDQLNRM